MSKARIATAQFELCPVEKFEDFEAQLQSAVKTSTERGAQLLVLPEYVTVNLIGLFNDLTVEKEQFRELATYSERVAELCAIQAKDYNIYIVAGSMPILGADNHNTIHNQAFIFSPEGEISTQGKVNMTTWENEALAMSPLPGLRLFDTSIGRIAINICYDIEFPEIARAATDAGAQIILVPSWTDDFQGFTRVRVCAQARCIENHIYVIQSSMVGTLNREPALNPIYGQSAILGPADSQFPRGGVIEEGKPNLSEVVVADLDLDLLEQVRKHGATRPVQDKDKLGQSSLPIETIKI